MMHYLITVSLCWIVLYALYRFIFEKETFFISNRTYLLVSLALGVIIPAYQWIPTEWYTKSVEVTYYLLPSDVMTETMAQPESAAFSWLFLLGALYWSGVALMALRFMHGLYRIAHLRYTGLSEYSNGLHIIHTRGDHLPFSFMSSVYLSENVELTDGMKSILQHEEVHVKSWHSLDVLFVQILHIFFWFNPILIFYKKSIQQLHEFAADATVIKDIPRKSYGQLLLRQSQSGLEIALANHFFHSQIKKRIQMMYKEKSKRPAMAKYLMALPVLMLLLVSFSTKTYLHEDGGPTNEQITIQSEQNPIQGNTLEDKFMRGEGFKIINSSTEDLAYSDKASNKSYKELKNTMKQMAIKANSPCKNQKLYSDDYKGKGRLTILFCEDNGKVTYAEIIERETEIDASLHKAVLKAFYSGKIKRTDSNVKPLPKPPVPPAPPAAPEPPVEPNAPKAVEPPVPPTPPAAPKAPKAPKALKDVVPPPPPKASKTSGDVFKVVENMPRFPGCETMLNEGKSELDVDACAKKKMLEYIYKNVKYPTVAKEKGIEGTTVVQFVVATDGQVKDVKLLRDIGGGAGDESVRVIEAMNDQNIKWTPGKQSGKAVNVAYTLPIKYMLQDKKDKALVGKKINENIRLRTDKAGKEPLYIVNGEVFDGLDTQINPDDIETIHVLKDQRALDKYGERGRNGVIEIQLKGDLIKSDLRLNLETFTISPNPASEQFTLDIVGGSKDPISILVYDVTGQTLFTDKISRYEGKLSKTISSFNFSNKVAFVKIEQNGKFDVRKVVFN